MARFSRIILNASAFVFALCVWAPLLAASVAAQSQGVSGLNLRMVDFGANAFVLIAPGQWQEINKQSWQRGAMFQELKRDAEEVHIRDESRQIGFAFRPRQMQAWILYNTPHYQPYGTILNVSSQARIPGSNVAWDTPQPPQQTAQPQPQTAQPQQPPPDPRIARYKAHEDAIRAQYPNASWMAGQYDASQRKLTFIKAKFANGSQIAAGNGYQVAGTRIHVTPAAYTGSDNNHYIVLDFDGTEINAASGNGMEAANQERDRGWFIESATLSVRPITNNVGVYAEGRYGYDQQQLAVLSRLQPQGALPHMQAAFSSKPLRGYTAGTSGDQISRHANYRLVEVLDVDNPNTRLPYKGTASLLDNPKSKKDVERGFEAIGGLVTGRLYTTSRLHKLPDQAFNGLMPVYQVVYVTNELYMPIAFRITVSATLQRVTVRGDTMLNEQYNTNQTRNVSFTQDIVVDLSAMQ